MDIPFDILLILGAGLVAFIQWLLKRGEKLRKESMREERRFGDAEEQAERPRAPAKILPFPPVPSVPFEVAKPRPAKVPPPPAPRPVRKRAAPVLGGRPYREPTRVAARLRSRRNLREAIVLREILGRPRALRSHHGGAFPTTRSS